MKILSWNINGIRTLPQYHPWNTLKTCSAILQELDADIICFQEMKTTRSQMLRDVAVPDPYDAFFSFPVTKGGYSGVAVFAKPAETPILKAEEGLSGVLATRLKPPLAAEERVSPYSGYPLAHELQCMPDDKGITPSDLVELDSEGRALVIDFGRFILINTYCPNEGSEERLPFKMNYHLMLEERVRKLILEGREVIVLGDINVCAAPIDHVEGDVGNNSAEFWLHPARAWFKKWIGPDGPMVDVLRNRWPDRKGMFTCWNTKISARASNYGTRIDYILLTRGLLPWFKHGDIQASVKGSDHCPIFIEMHDEIVTESGDILPLFIHERNRPTPRLSAKYWPEFSRSQKLLSTFFTRKGSISDIDTSESASCMTSNGLMEVATVNQALDDTAIVTAADNTRDPHLTPPKPTPTTSSPTGSQAKSSQKRKGTSVEGRDSVSERRSRPKKARAGQSTIHGFFDNKSNPQSSKPKRQATKGSPSENGNYQITQSQEMDRDLLLAIELSKEVESGITSTKEESGEKDGKKSWSQLFAPLEPPKCSVHGEPCKELTTTKPGPNKGKNFWICSRPVGPGYDAGKSKRLREDVDPQYKCDFFKWSSDVKKEALRTSKSTRG